MRDVRLLIHLICRATRLYRLTALSALGIPGWAASVWGAGNCRRQRSPAHQRFGQGYVGAPF